mgnify:CR=1 FL=1
MAARVGNVNLDLLRTGLLRDLLDDGFPPRLAKRAGELHLHQLSGAGGVEPKLEPSVGQAHGLELAHTGGVLRVGTGLILGAVGPAAPVPGPGCPAGVVFGGWPWVGRALCAGAAAAAGLP